MYLRKAYNKKTGRTYLSIVHNYRDPITRITRAKVIKSIGYLDDLQKEFEDPIAHFSALAREMELARRENTEALTFSVSKSEKLTLGTDLQRNFGYVALSLIYHELGVHTFFENRQRRSADTFHADAIIRTLVFARSLFQTHHFFDNEDPSADEMYKCLSFLEKQGDALKLWLNKRVHKLYGRNTDLVYCNIVPSTDTASLTGLITDNNGIPITDILLSVSEQLSFANIKKQFDLGRILLVSDLTMHSDSINFIEIYAGRSGYIFGVPIKESLHSYLLDPEGYTVDSSGYFKKSRCYSKTVLVTTSSGKQIKKDRLEKQIVFCRKETADKQADLANYRIIITSETEENDDKIIERYLHLQEIKKFWGLSENNPLLISFLACTLASILELKLHYKYPMSELLSSLSKCNCTLLQENFYIFQYYDKVLHDIGLITGIDFSNRCLSLSEIKKIIGDTK